MFALLLLAAAVSAPPKADPTLTTLERALTEGGRAALYLPFEFGKARLRPEADADFAAIVRVLERLPNMKLVIEGHADSLATPEQNMALSHSRARAVVATLQRMGVKHERLSLTAKGQEQPITDATRESLPARRNERIELVDPDFSGVRLSRAVEAGDAPGSKEPVFRRVPSYYIAAFEEYDSWRGGRLAALAGVAMEGRAELITYRHPDAGKPGARLPTAGHILSQYAQAARQSGGYQVYLSTSTALYKITEITGEIWMGIEITNPEQYRVTVVASPAAR